MYSKAVTELTFYLGHVSVSFSLNVLHDIMYVTIKCETLTSFKIHFPGFTF